MASISAATMATIAAVSAVASAGVSAYSAVKSGETQEDAAEYNAEIQRNQAKEALQRGAIEAATKKDRARQVAASQAEAAGIGGIGINSGTSLALLTETAGLGELDALRSVNNARREAWGLKAQSELDLFQGRAAGRAGVLNAGGTLLSGAGNAYYGYKAGMK